jgi:hypothetical protein
VLGSSTLKNSRIELFYDSLDGEFTLVAEMPGLGQAAIFDCVTRAQWGRNIMLFGHMTSNGKFIASGRATLDDHLLTVKLTSRPPNFIPVDSTLPHLQPFV